jgi:pimeloyl-ACP methyl ester carboxylesterase
MVPDDAAEAAREFAAGFAADSAAAASEAAALLSEGGTEQVVESFPEEFQEGPMDAADALEQYWWGLRSQYGPFRGVESVSVDGEEATVTFDLEAGTETASVALDEEGVAGFAFDPEYTPPSYAEPDSFTERDVTVDTGDVDLGGVLTVPDGEGPFPGVLLVHGAGINHPDGTAGATKLLKDVAWGLASEGIATLRYEKRLLDHEVADEDYTLDRLVVDDAVAALDELAAAPEVDADTAFVAGHSQGGMCAPRIAARHGDVAGVVVLDSLASYDVDPEGDVEFMRYNMDPYGDLTDEEEAALDAQRQELQRVADGDFDAEDTILGRPGAFWESRIAFDPAGTVEGLGVPVFAASTERVDHEHQQPLAEMSREGFEEWQAVDAADGSRFEYYEDVGHYFREGPVPHTMESLYFGGNVASYVVADVAEWVHGVADT